MVTRFHLSTRTGGRAPSFATLIVALLLVPLFALAWLVVGGLLLLVGTGVAAAALIVLLIAGWRARRIVGETRSRKGRAGDTIEADYYIVEEREGR